MELEVNRMNKISSVFVYGATGYTGRLVCEDLYRRKIPFTMGGRNLERLEAFRQELGDPQIPIISVSHILEDLQKAFEGHEIVINVTGPFSLLGEVVVQAALKAGTHYLDTTGEQDFMLLVKERYGQEALRLKRVVINANSWYYSLGEAAAHYLRDRYPHLDTYTIVYQPKGEPTIASKQSVLRTIRRPGYCRVHGRLEPNGALKLVSVLIPGEVVPTSGFIMPGGEAIHLGSEEGVQNVRVYGVGEQMAEASGFFKVWRLLSKFFGPLLDKIGDRLVLLIAKTPPPEDPTYRFVVLAAGEGKGDRKISVLYGSCPYVVTGFICGQASEWLLAGKYRRTGVISTAQAFGASETIEALKEIGVTHKVIE